jgi:type VI protein secretion system component VasK
MYPKIVLSEDKLPFVSKRWKEKQNIKFDISFTYIIMIGFIFILLIYYIWIINTNATKWFNIRDLEQQKKNLMIEKEQLEVKIANLESLDWIKDENMENVENMEKVENPDYLVIKDGVNYVYNN